MRLRTTILPALALAGALFATWSVLGQAGVPPRIDPPGAPPVNPYRGAIAGLGAVEPASQVVAVASELSGVIVAVHVQAGDTVAAGAPLLALDDRTYHAALASAVAEIAEANAARAQGQAEHASARAERDRAQADSTRFAALVRQNFAASRQRYETALADAQKAEARVALAQAQIAAAEARAARAEASALRARIDLDRVEIRAPIAGTVLRVNARAGEYARAAPMDEPLVAMGQLNPLHVRVQIDEVDAPRLVTNRLATNRLATAAPATAFLRGDGTRAAPLAFVRLEPQAQPKRYLSNAPGERTDTRVVEVIYRLEPGVLPVQVGQMLDVFIEAPSGPARLARQ
jgi:multidrug efflux pump subunit AcrA (membrane-fusion protein)